MHRVLVVSLCLGSLALGCQRSDTNLFSADAHAASLASQPSAPQPAAGPGGPAGENRLLTPLPSLAPLVKQLRPVVVNINSRFKPHATRSRGMARRLPDPHERGEGDEGDGQGQEDPMERFFRYFGPHGGGGAPDQQERRGLGSGFLIGEGMVLTNNHVVRVQDGEGTKFRNMDEIKVITDDLSPGGAREYSAHVIGADDKSDLALLKIDDPNAKMLPGAALGDSDALEVGDYVVAIGEPFGLQATVTAGIVSAKERSQFGGPYSDYLQTDASINPGNSGGPLFNLRGEVVGVNSAIISGANTIGFAIPIAVVKQILPQLKTKGHVERGYLGVAPQALTQDMVEQLGLKSNQGALVADVVKDGPAEKAGLKAGDVITAVNGRAVADNNQLTRDVGAVPPGGAVKLDIVRDGKPKSIELKVARRPEEVEDKGLTPGEKGGEPASGDPLGLVVEDLTPEMARRARVEPGTRGVVVTDVGNDSPAGNASIEPGDVLVELGRQPIGSQADYKKAIKNIKKGDTVLARVRRGQAVQYVTVKIPR